MEGTGKSHCKFRALYNYRIDENEVRDDIVTIMCIKCDAEIGVKIVNAQCQDADKR